MKKLDRLFLLVLIFFSWHCGYEKSYQLTGKMGNNLNSELSLEVDDNTVNGHLAYEHNGVKIPLKGVLKKDKLTLQEFNHQNKVNGEFYGTFDGKQYHGVWENPRSGKKVTFSFVAVEKAKKTNRTSPSTTEAGKKMQAVYSAWVKEDIRKGESWPEQKWEAYLQKHLSGKVGMDEYFDNCVDAYPDKLYKIKFGDVNGDGITDGWSYVSPLMCSYGTWLSRMRGMPVFFISQKNGSYKMEFEQEILADDVGTHGSVDTILPNGTVIYTGVEFTDQDPNCCPSEEWKAHFRYQKGAFKLIKSTRKKH